MNTRMLVEAEAPSVLLRQELNVYVKDWSELILQGTGSRTDATMSQDAITKALALKADKTEIVRKLTGNNIVYINNSAGNLSSLLFATGAVASSIVQRDSAGRITATAAASDNQVTTLSQVRGMITAGPSLLIVQSEGQNTGYVMSQKAVTDALTTIRSNLSSNVSRLDGLIKTNSDLIDAIDAQIETILTDITDLQDKDDDLAASIGTVGGKVTVLQSDVSDLGNMVKANTTAIGTKLDKTGGTITGSLTITQNLTVQGTTTTHESQILTVKDPLIVANSDKATLSSYGGLLINTDANNTYGMVYDPGSSSVKLGLGTYNSTTKKFAFNSGEGLPIVVRDESAAWTNGHYAKWDSTKHAFVDGGVMPTIPKNYVTTDTTQTITGAKTFNNAVVFKGTTKIGNTQYAADKIIEGSTTYNLPDRAGTMMVDADITPITSDEIVDLFAATYNLTFTYTTSSSQGGEYVYFKVNGGVSDKPSATDYDYRMVWAGPNKPFLYDAAGTEHLMPYTIPNVRRVAYYSATSGAVVFINDLMTPYNPYTLTSDTTIKPVMKILAMSAKPSQPIVTEE